jgi:hypothetical protein
MRPLLLALGGLASSAVLPACFTYPCDRDVLACEEGDALAIDRECKLDGDLELVLGEGNGMFVPLPDAVWPEVHHGVQGGIHFMLGLELAGVDPDHGEFEIEVEARDCDESCSAMETLATRTFTIDESYFERDGDALVLADVVLLLDREPRAKGELTVRVTDSCGRTAESVHAM